MERYYLHEQRKCPAGRKALKEALARGCTPEEAALGWKKGKCAGGFPGILIITDSLSGDLEKFRQKGLGFFRSSGSGKRIIFQQWNGYRFRLYGQEKLNYGILVEYMPVENNYMRVLQ